MLSLGHEGTSFPGNPEMSRSGCKSQAAGLAGSGSGDWSQAQSQGLSRPWLCLWMPYAPRLSLLGALPVLVSCSQLEALMASASRGHQLTQQRDCGQATRTQVHTSLPQEAEMPAALGLPGCVCGGVRTRNSSRAPSAWPRAWHWEVLGEQEMNEVPGLLKSNGIGVQSQPHQ